VAGNNVELTATDGESPSPDSLHAAVSSIDSNNIQRIRRPLVRQGPSIPADTGSALAELDYSAKLLRVEARTTDQSTVDVRLGQQLCGVHRFDRAAVLNSHS